MLDYKDGFSGPNSFLSYVDGVSPEFAPVLENVVLDFVYFTFAVKFLKAYCVYS